MQGSGALERPLCRAICNCTFGIFVRTLSCNEVEDRGVKPGILGNLFCDRSSLSEWIGGEDDDDVVIA